MLSIVLYALDESAPWAEEKATVDILPSNFRLSAPQRKIIATDREGPQLQLFDDLLLGLGW